jgi:hypothetical protein
VLHATCAVMRPQRPRLYYRMLGMVLPTNEKQHQTKQLLHHMRARPGLARAHRHVGGQCVQAGTSASSVHSLWQAGQEYTQVDRPPPLQYCYDNTLSTVPCNSAMVTPDIPCITQPRL